jgi:hypothetical protein
VIIGAHAVLFSTNPDADRTFLRDVLGLAYASRGYSKADGTEGGC